MPVRLPRVIVALCLVVCTAGVSAQPAERRPPRGEAAAGRMAEALRAAGVTLERDVPYAGTDNPRQRLDVYLPERAGAARPAGSTRPTGLPVIVFIHGGGWSGGDKFAGAAQLLPLLRSGEYAGVSVGYRLSGEAKWPAQGNDVKAAIRFVRANAGRYGLDPDRIAVMGRSAGGHLALYLGTTGDDPALAGDVGEDRGVSTRVKCVVNYFGVADLSFVGRRGAGANLDAAESRLFEGDAEARRAASVQASPALHVDAGDAPTLTIHGDRDPTVPYTQGVQIHDALKAAGVESYLVTVRGGGHGDFGAAANDRVEAFLAKQLLGREVAVSEAPVEFTGRQGAPGDNSRRRSGPATRP